MEDAFFWFAYNFGDTDKIYELHSSGIDIPLLDAVMALTVQLVYCWRIWVLSRWRVVPILTALVRFAFAFIVLERSVSVWPLDWSLSWSMRSCYGNTSECRNTWTVENRLWFHAKKSFRLPTTLNLDFNSFRLPMMVFVHRYYYAYPWPFLSDMALRKCRRWHCNCQLYGLYCMFELGTTVPARVLSDIPCIVNTSPEEFYNRNWLDNWKKSHAPLDAHSRNECNYWWELTFIVCFNYPEWRSV